MATSPNESRPGSDPEAATLLGQHYGGRLRVRACGVLIERDGMLLALHRGIGPAGYLWAPPGGGVEFGHGLTETVVREFAEETSLVVETAAFLGVYEVIRPPIHAIELFYEVRRLSGEVSLGTDPEEKYRTGLPPVLEAVRFMTRAEVPSLPAGACHEIALRWSKGLPLNP